MSKQVTLPSVDRLLRSDPMIALIEAHGRQPTTDAVRDVLAGVRAALVEGESEATASEDEIAALVSARLESIRDACAEASDTRSVVRLLVWNLWRLLQGAYVVFRCN